MYQNTSVCVELNLRVRSIIFTLWALEDTKSKRDVNQLYKKAIVDEKAIRKYLLILKFISGPLSIAEFPREFLVKRSLSDGIFPKQLYYLDFQGGILY